MKKAEHKAEMEKRGMSVGEHETCASMMRRIRVHVDAELGGTSSTLMGFGKHAHRTYQEVMDQYDGYVN